MKKVFYAALLSASLGCSKPQTTFLDYPVTVCGVNSVYSKDSNGDCHLKTQRDEKEWRVYDRGCNNLAESAMIVSADGNFSYFQLTPENQQGLDLLLKEAVASFPRQDRTHDHDPLQF